jgi:hypothetical protein
MRRLLVPLIVGCLLVTAAPAQARYGRSPVNTWVRYGDQVVRHANGTLRFWAASGSTHRVVWSVRNLGRHIYPTLHSVAFSGCEDGKGFHFRYTTPGGTDVTWAVTHRGYRQAGVDPGERAWLNIWITSTRSDRSYACKLTGDGNGIRDHVWLNPHS